MLGYYTQRASEVADFESVEARHLIAMLGWGSQSCVRNVDKTCEHRQKNNGEPRQIYLEHASVIWAESSSVLSMLFIGIDPSSEFEFGSAIAFGLLQVDQSSDPPSSTLVA